MVSKFKKAIGLMLIYGLIQQFGPIQQAIARPRIKKKSTIQTISEMEQIIQETTSRTINHPAEFTIPEPNGKLYVVRGKDIIEHRNPEKENYNIVLKLIEYKDNGTPGYSFSDRIHIIAQINCFQPAGKNAYEDQFESQDVSIKIGVGYKGTNSIEACFDGIVSAPYSVLTKDKQDQISTIINHALKELNPALYQKPKPSQRITTP